MTRLSSAPTCITAAVLLLTAAAAPARVCAQGLRDLPAPTSASKGHIISTNPFLPLFGFFSAEYEQRVKDNVSFAIAGSHLNFDNRYTNLDVKLRLYPNDQALEGFGIAASLGVARIHNNGDCDGLDSFGGCRPTPAQSFTTPAFAVEIGYQWLLGRTKSTAVTAGFGAKRYLGGDRDDYRGAERVLPTGRLSIGYVF